MRCDTFLFVRGVVITQSLPPPSLTVSAVIPGAYALDRSVEVMAIHHWSRLTREGCLSHTGSASRRLVAVDIGESTPDEQDPLRITYVLWRLAGGTRRRMAILALDYILSAEVLEYISFGHTYL